MIHGLRVSSIMASKLYEVLLYCLYNDAEKSFIGSTPGVNPLKFIVSDLKVDWNDKNVVIGINKHFIGLTPGMNPTLLFNF